jgi:hypothetical protein
MDNIPELIMQDLLKSAQLVSAQNGYAVTISARRIGTAREPEPRADLDAELILDGFDFASFEGPAKTWWYLKARFECCIIQRGDTSGHVDTRILTMGAELARGLMQDAYRGTYPNTSNYLAQDTFIDSITPRNDPQDEGFTLSLRVYFRTAAFNLNQQ